MDRANKQAVDKAFLISLSISHIVPRNMITVCSQSLINTHSKNTGSVNLNMSLRHSGWRPGWRRIRTNSNISAESYNGSQDKSPTKSMQETGRLIDIDNGENLSFITAFLTIVLQEWKVSWHLGRIVLRESFILMLVNNNIFYQHQNVFHLGFVTDWGVDRNCCWSADVRVWVEKHSIAKGCHM